jgi:hypothetical protein
MMDWEMVLTLLQVCELSRGYGAQLQHLHDHALATLASIDPVDLPVGQHDHLEPLEDEED